MDEKPSSLITIAIPVLIACALLGAIVAVLTSNPFGSQLRLPDSSDPMMNALLETDPELVMYTEADSFPTGFSTTRALAITDSNMLFIASEARVLGFRSSGAKTGFAATFDANVIALGVDRTGRLFVSLGDEIHVFSEDGTPEDVWPLDSDQSVVTSFLFDEDNLVYTADAGERTIHVWDENGRRLRSFGDFIIPSYYLDMGLNPDGDVVAVNPGRHRIETFNDDGDLIAWWGDFSMVDPVGFCGCCNPVHIALMQNGDVITSEKGITRVKLYDAEGTLKGYVAGPDLFTDHDLDCISPEFCFASGGNDIAVGTDGQVYLLSLTTGDVRIFVPKADSIPS